MPDTELDAMTERVRLAAKLAVIDMGQEMSSFTEMLSYFDTEDIQTMADLFRKAIVEMWAELDSRGVEHD